MFNKILVANRGEIAVRVIRACRELAVRTVAVYSEADRECLHLRLADEAVCIGPFAARESYLNQQRILCAAKITGAQAVHPGYGFLAENASFARACREAGLVFIGPPPEAIAALGDKIAAKRLAESAGVHVIPGAVGDPQALLKAAGAVGFPVMVKAAAGGGGKGLRLVREPKALASELEKAAGESQAAFGDGTLYLEKFIERPRHVEIQICADAQGRVAAAVERDCTVQRRHQKLIEESPSPAVDPELRRKLQEAALRLAKACGYVNLGTVEFLLGPDGRFYFMEVNTRLQVEHPVTETVTGLDLVVEQIRLAAGEPLSFDQARASEIRAHSIEHRINAEDPGRGFAPCPGRVEGLLLPGGPGVRLETHLYCGYTVPSYYDSLIAKLIVGAPDRRSAIARAKRALLEFAVDGIATTIPFHLQALGDLRFADGHFDTHFAAQLLKEDQNAGKNGGKR
ncbi:MAG: acetyl-CoA carboxylase biotin carboxylase subunit [Elusimicrobia bacterium]|nr:acetyl-CoA carboxylase biotin carboxylase subunit [Elusimicrobiota bacterium]